MTDLPKQLQLEILLNILQGDTSDIFIIDLPNYGKDWVTVDIFKEKEEQYKCFTILKKYSVEEFTKETGECLCQSKI